jgi:HAD superfamily hydrolase (TIGR01549 family)
MSGILLRASSHIRLFNNTFFSGPKSRGSLSTPVRGLSAMARPVRPRRFAPLDPAKQTKDEKRPKLKGIVFDVDGTLCKSPKLRHYLNMTNQDKVYRKTICLRRCGKNNTTSAQREKWLLTLSSEALGIQKPTDILDHVYSLPEADQEEAHEKIRSIERTAMKSQQPQAGLVELMDYLDSRGVQKGICTRNFDAPVEHLLETFLPSHRFGPIVTREFRPPKPDPAGILHIAKEWMHEDGGDSLIMVGDSIDDMTAGFNKHLAEHEHTDLVVKQLDDLIDVLENGFEGRVEGNEESVNAKGLVEEAIS